MKRGCRCDSGVLGVLDALRREVREDVREVREEVREVRESALKAHVGLMRRQVWAIVVLGLALGGKDLAALALGWS